MQGAYVRRVGDYHVRLCFPSDLRDVIAINWITLPEHYSDYFFEELLRECPESFLAAEKDGKILGYIMCRIEYGLSATKKFGLARKGHIVSVAVLEEHRQKGLATALVEAALHGMRVRGCGEAYLEVRVSNHAAVSLYEKLGFKTSSRIEGYYRDGEAGLQLGFSLS